MAAIEVDNFKRAIALLGRSSRRKINMNMEFNCPNFRSPYAEDDDTEEEEEKIGEETEEGKSIESNDSINTSKEKSTSVNESKCDHDNNDQTLIEDPHEGTVVCSVCGVVIIDQLVCESNEWRTFGDDTQNEKWQKSRVGGIAQRFLSSESNLNTTISSQNGGHGQSFDSTIVRMFRRKNFDNGVMAAMKQLDEMSDRINIPKSITEYAQYIYYKMYKKCNYKGIILFTDAKIGACLYIACYQANCPRTINEICAITESEHDSIQRAIKRIRNSLKIHIGEITGRDLIPRYCGYLQLSRDISRNAMSLAKLITDEDKERKFQPETIAATAIFFASVSCRIDKYKRTQRDIAQCLNITPQSINECCNRFLAPISKIISKQSTKT